MSDLPPPPVIDVVVVTGEQPAKVAAMLEDAGLPDERFALTILCGDPAPLGAGAPRGCRVFHFAGESVFHLRRRLPAVARDDAGWVVLMEDHNALEPSWKRAVLDATGAAEATGCRLVIGAVENNTSTGFWSWAHFLHTFAFHWAPRIAEPRSPIVANIAMRRDAIGTDALELGQFETLLLPSLLAGSRLDAGFPVDHVQHRNALQSTIAHFDNGRVTGAFLADHHPKARKHALRHARHVLLSRPLAIVRILARHPHRSRVPALTPLAVVWLPACHAAGTLVGAFAGFGRAPWRLE